MQTEFSTRLWPYVSVFIACLLLALVNFGRDLTWSSVFAGAAFFCALGCYFTRFSVSVHNDSILMAARFGAITDRVYFNEIDQLSSKGRSGIKNMGRHVQIDSYRKALTIRLKTGEEYVIPNTQIPDLDQMIIAIRTKMEGHLQSQSLK